MQGVHQTSSDPLAVAKILHLDAQAESFAHGGAVSTWTDQSGAGNHATQSTSSYRPTFATGAINGHSAINFNRSANQYMDLPGSLFNIASGTSFAVFTPTAGPPGGGKSNYVLAGWAPPSPSPTNRWYIDFDHLGNVSTRVESAYFGFTGTVGVPQVMVVRSDGHAQMSERRCPKESATLTASVSGTGTNCFVGALASAWETWAGYIGEIIHYNTALSDAAVAAEMSGLAAKWRFDNCPDGWSVGSIRWG